MLHLRQSAQPSARWAHQGWPALLRWSDRRSEPEQLYWALTAIPSAAAAGDLAVLDDLLTEIRMWLDRIWRDPKHVVRGSAADFLSISTQLWAETQRGRGAEDLDQIRLHARLLRNLAGPDLPPPRSSSAMVPTYRRPQDRIRGGRLPLTEHAASLTDRDTHEQFLLLLAVVLSNRGGHVSDYLELRCLSGADGSRTGWTADHSGAAGSLLGSVDNDRQELRLRPRPCLTAVNRIRDRSSADRWTVDEIGWALAEQWLVDTTLIAGPADVRRLPTCLSEVLTDRRPEQIWRVSLEVFHPLQFFSAQAPSHPRRSSLRSVPPTD